MILKYSLSLCQEWKNLSSSIFRCVSHAWVHLELTSSACTYICTRKATGRNSCSIMPCTLVNHSKETFEFVHISFMKYSYKGILITIISFSKVWRKQCTYNSYFCGRLLMPCTSLGTVHFFFHINCVFFPYWRDNAPLLSLNDFESGLGLQDEDTKFSAEPWECYITEPIPVTFRHNNVFLFSEYSSQYSCPSSCISVLCMY
jgi:hypothetical protein